MMENPVNSIPTGLSFEELVGATDQASSAQICFNTDWNQILGYCNSSMPQFDEMDDMNVNCDMMTGMETMTQTAHLSPDELPTTYDQHMNHPVDFYDNSDSGLFDQFDMDDGSMFATHTMDSMPLPGMSSENPMQLADELLEWKDEVKEEVNVDEDYIERLVPCLENLLPLNQAYSAVQQEMIEMLEDYRRNLSLPRQMRLADILAEEEKREQLRATICNEDRALEVFPLGVFGTPYFHDAQMQGPMLKDSIFNTLPLFNVTLSADTGRPFTAQETASLNLAIRTEAMRIYSNELLQRNGLKANGELNQTNFDSMNVNNVSEQELYEYACKYDELVDWKHIRTIATEVAPWRTVDDLRRQWDHHLRPDVNHQTVRWTREENQKLNQLVEEADAGGGVDWHAITAALGTRRSVFECFRRYQSRYNPYKRKFGWTPAENAQLTKVMADYSVDSIELIDWASIRQHFPGRSKTQIFSHFKYHCCLVNNNDFSRTEDEVIRQSIRQGFDAEVIARMLKNKHNKAQIKQRAKMLLTANQRRSGYTKIGTKIAGLIRRYGAAVTEQCKVEAVNPAVAGTSNPQSQQEELNDAIWRAIRREEMIEREKKTGRPPKSPTMMEAELRDMVRPLIIINTKRARQTCLPGDGREHGLILTALYRFFLVNFVGDFINENVTKRLNPDELDHLGIDRQDHMSFVNLLDHVSELPGRTGDTQYSTGALHRQSLTIPTRAQWQLHSLPPTLTTLTGLRGLLLYRNALQLQARDEATRFDENSTDAIDAVDATDVPDPTLNDAGNVIIEPFGNSRADQLLLFRLLSLFYWPDRFSKVQCEVIPSTVVETGNAPAQAEKPCKRAKEPGKETPKAKAPPKKPRKTKTPPLVQTPPRESATADSPATTPSRQSSRSRQPRLIKDYY